MAVYPEIARKFSQWSSDLAAVSRKARLDSMAEAIARRRAGGKTVYLIFICTHNSRRSQMAQCWAAAVTAYFGLDVEAYSGGTEVTAFHPNAVSALQKAGFEIEREDPEAVENPVYAVSFADQAGPKRSFSKLYSDPVNPDHDFIAVMTCSEAEEACPFIPGADVRVSLPFEDPKRFDGSPEAPMRYEECSLRIARDLFYVFDKINRYEQ